MGKSTSRPICLVCHRPFDPTSPGATHTMGPTCAKKALAPFDESSPQMDLLQTAREAVIAPPRRLRRTQEASQSPRLPQALCEAHRLAKIAFDELYREFCSAPHLHEREEALALLVDAKARCARTIRLADPVLEWLEPEHDLSLLLDSRGDQVYLARTINDVLTVLAFDPSRSPTARKNVETILGFHKLLIEHRDEESRVQLSLGGVLAP